MPQTDWGGLLPEQVADWINFDRDNVDWHYEGKASTSMASRQAEGVAYLWNMLSANNAALLADEVGMGKTFQALGVAAMLWKMKPDAKVLVMAPNRDICAHWERELNAFIRFHYRQADHCVKNSVDGGPVPVVHKCWRLDDMATAVEASAGHLYLTTIYSLSGLVPQAEKDNNNNLKARANAKKLRKRIQHALDGDGFDLVIIDEAHYFRNKNGDSQRVNAAESFFGSESSRLAHKALLLTATPSHSRLNDINNILSYFLEDEMLEDKKPEELMQNYALRRFRRMKGIDRYHSKREYRNEKAVSCEFNDRPESEMFFALYQKKLVTELNFTRNNKSLLYGFLEGFESPGRRSSQLNTSVAESTEDVKEEKHSDFSKARDTKLLSRLSEQYFNSFGKSPDHPKYGQLVEMCLPDELFDAPRDLHEDKHLVFVRRIPSVRELTQRINEAYDAVLAVKIYRAWGLDENDSAVKDWQATSWSREGFNELILKVKSQTITENEEKLVDDEAFSDVADGDGKLGSNIADIFVKKNKGSTTDCLNVRLRFRNHNNMFAMFLEPASDYLTEGYEYFYENDQSKRADYVNAARDRRLCLHEKLSQKLESDSGRHREKYDSKNVLCAWSLIYPLLSESRQKKILGWAQERSDIAENFANYIKAGFLFASPVMVELYAWFTEYNRSDSITDVQKKYANFIEFVKPKLEMSLMLSYFSSALDTFEALCEKIIDHKLGEWEKEWRSLTSLQNPAWYASGESTNRQRLILGFNSPFYPNVLVSTSVFQEGVNLHLQCRKVHHYGIAGSPGDNEQRVGRVDRLFGKVNELLKTDGTAELEINYPFLKSSVDEDQVASFISRKFHVEDRMDNCTQSSFDKTVELTRESWHEFLRKPVEATEKELAERDPYEAWFDGRFPQSGYVPYENHEAPDIVNHISNLLGELLEPAKDTLYSVEKNKHNPNAIFLIDPAVKHESLSRRQPVLVEKHFSAEFSALVKGTVYYISLTSPLSSKENLNDSGCDYDAIILLADKLTKQCPLVRLVVNEDAQKSHFYLHARIDLPLFVGVGDMGMLSKHELYVAFQQLKNFSDQFELGLFSGDQDLVVSQLRLSGHLKEASFVKHGSEREFSVQKHNECWIKLDSPCGMSEHIFSEITFSGFNKRYVEPVKEMQLQPHFIRVLIVNGVHPFVNFWPTRSGHVRAGIGYPSGDIQEDERKLLERWFEYVVQEQ